ncbi:universal stress protein [Parerythrobacter jejuensis]|uniref:Universal stress protein n=1 Tax=Parerythrobacter jejuensis TaxID=795812 RepID=A0A845ARH1_9SPHN|nr:universal stress protein [Parerythrobacter jejuensis]MXP31793.1 universal stress protein [Parerythrobacter jejuensis]
MKAIIVHAFDDAGFENRLQVSLDLARSFDGHLTLVNAIPVEAGVPGDFYGAAFAAMVPVWREGADKLREKTKKDMGNEDVPYDWIEVAGSASAGLLRHSALSDLIVVGPNEPQIDGRAPSATVGDLALHARCPVLVVPDTQSRIDVEAPVLVAWDGSAEASRALRNAMPVLRRASKVFLACVKEHGDSVDDFDFPPLKGAEYLARHGIESEIVELAKADRKVAAVLYDAAARREAGMIVMGAYGHWRLAERVFGGVTRAMLSDVKLPLFMTH